MSALNNEILSSLFMEPQQIIRENEDIDKLNY